MIYFQEERVRKSSLAQPGSKGRKKSVVMFDEEKTKTIEFEDDIAKNKNKDEFDENSVSTPGHRNFIFTHESKYFLDPEFIPVRKFSRFNDSMKINKRRMSREEKHENITTPTTTSNSQT